MRGLHQRALGCLYLIYIALLRIGYGVVLDRVRNVMVDAKRPLTYPPGPIRAIYASFANLNPAYVQLWKNSSTPNVWLLDWQIEVVPKFGNGTIEIINVPSSDQVTLDPEHRLGLTNRGFPGPLKGFHDLRGGLLLSTNRTSAPPKVNDLFNFDDLPLPYQIPVFFCNRTGCPDELVQPTSPTTLPPMTPSVSPVVSQNMFLDDRLILGLLIWNVILSLLVLILLFALLCLCLDLEKKRRIKSRMFGRTTPQVPYYHFPPAWYNAIRETDTDSISPATTQTYTKTDDVTHQAVFTTVPPNEKGRYEEADRAWEYLDVQQVYM